MAARGIPSSLGERTLDCGYDVQFEPELENKYKCPVCLAAMKNAVQTKCGHRFCKTCLRQSTGNTRYAKCPVDNTWFDTTKDIFADTAVRREVLSLTVLCSNKSDGCLWKGDLRNLDDHLDQCPEVKVECPNKCDNPDVLRRRSLQGHLLMCPMRLQKCNYCSNSITAADLAKHQLLVCNKFPVNCAVCGETGIIRDQVKQHLDVVNGNCPLVTLKCDFDYVGCHFQDKRKNMPSHYEQACHQHMMYLCVKLAEHDEKLGLQQRQLDVVSEQYHALKEISEKQESIIQEQGELLVEQAVRMKELETCSFGGPLIWKIQLLDQRGRRTADNFHSPSIYTGRPGYKLSCSLQLGEEQESAVIYVQSLTGTYDDQISFPFNGICSVTIRDQTDKEKANPLTFNIKCQDLLPKPVNSDTQLQSTSAKLEFLSTNELLSERYLKDGMICLTVTVQPNDSHE